MPGLLDAFALPLLFAEKAAAAPRGRRRRRGTGSSTFLPYVAVIGLWFYLLLIRPQQKQDKQRRDMLGALKKNDRVLTSAGIYGTVVSVDEKEDRVLVRVDDDRGVKVAFSKASIVRILGAPDEKEKSPKEKASETA